jgi:hypothetical protein
VMVRIVSNSDREGEGPPQPPAPLPYVLIREE